MKAPNDSSGIEKKDSSVDKSTKPRFQFSAMKLGVPGEENKSPRAQGSPKSGSLIAIQNARHKRNSLGEEKKIWNQEMNLN